MKTLTVLQRLAKQAVDRERQALQTIADETADIEAQIRHLEHGIEREISVPLDFMSSGITLAAFIKDRKARISAFEAQRQTLQSAYDEQVKRVRQERVEEKRLALLEERRSQKAAREAAEREQKMIDELASIRHGRS